MIKIQRQKYDKSTKKYEIIRKSYVFLRKNRKLFQVIDWEHYKYYKTVEGCNQAERYLKKLYKIVDSEYIWIYRYKATLRYDMSREDKLKRILNKIRIIND